LRARSGFSVFRFQFSAGRWEGRGAGVDRRRALRDCAAGRFAGMPAPTAVGRDQEPRSAVGARLRAKGWLGKTQNHRRHAGSHSKLPGSGAGFSCGSLLAGEALARENPESSPACRLPQQTTGIRSRVQLWEPACGRSFGSGEPRIIAGVPAPTAVGRDQEPGSAVGARSRAKGWFEIAQNLRRRAGSHSRRHGSGAGFRCGSPLAGEKRVFRFSGFSFRQAVGRGVVRVLIGGELSGIVLPADSPACRLPQ
jgi:hypothetical protein